MTNYSPKTTVVTKQTVRRAYGNTTKVAPAAKREVWRCGACGRVTAIGDMPVSRGCKCL